MSDLTFNAYQNESGKTAIYPERGKLWGLIYCTLGLAGEAGETANKVKKILRDCNGELTEEKKKEISKELGGVLWYLANTATELGFSLSDIGDTNLEQLQSRQKRGVLGGSGDNR